MSRCRLTPERREREAKFIRTVGEWPRWPHLPMKRLRQGEWPELGVIVDTSGVHSPDVLPEPITVIAHDSFRETGRLEYATVDALLDDGWIVD